MGHAQRELFKESWLALIELYLQGKSLAEGLAHIRKNTGALS